MRHSYERFEEVGGAESCQGVPSAYHRCRMIYQYGTYSSSWQTSKELGAIACARHH